MNKYEIYVNRNELANYIKENNIVDKGCFRRGQLDFQYVNYDTAERVNYFDEDNFINGWTKSKFLEYVCDFGGEVSPEEFLIAIGYLPEKEEMKIQKINPEDIHYICEADTEDRLSVSADSFGDTYIRVGGDYNFASVRLSPEGLIELGSDLVKLGVQLRDSE